MSRGKSKYDTYIEGFKGEMFKDCNTVKDVVVKFSLIRNNVTAMLIKSNYDEKEFEFRMNRILEYRKKTKANHDSIDYIMKKYNETDREYVRMLYDRYINKNNTKPFYLRYSFEEFYKSRLRIKELHNRINELGIEMNKETMYSIKRSVIKDKNKKLEDLTEEEIDKIYIYARDKYKKPKKISYRMIPLKFDLDGHSSVTAFANAKGFNVPRTIELYRHSKTREEFDKNIEKYLKHRQKLNTTKINADQINSNIDAICKKFNLSQNTVFNFAWSRLNMSKLDFLDTEKLNELELKLNTERKWVINKI